jgi:tetratricopeptide (TPR) repeat protein
MDKTAQLIFKAAAPAFLTILISIAVPQNIHAADFDPDSYNSGGMTYRTPDTDQSRPGFDRKKAARDYLTLGYLPDAVDMYRNLKGDDDWEQLEAEYAYALALSGYNEPAMLYLDDAHAQEPSGGGPYYYAGMVFMFAGYGDLAKNFFKIAGAGGGGFYGIAASAPGLKKNIGAVSFAPMDGDFKKELGYNGSGGVVVLNVFPGPEKFLTGIQAHDVIISLNGAAVESAGGILNIINKKQAGDIIGAVIWRDGAKKSINVRVGSSDELAGLPELAKKSAAPDDTAKGLLVRAVTMLSEKKYFTAILIYRGLIEKYPDWEIPYLGYTLALEKAGAFDCEKQASKQAQAASGNDSQAKQQLEKKAKQLDSAPADKQDKWIKAQTTDSFAEKPAGFYLGFGGGQLMFGGSNGFKLVISGRAGMLMNTGEDISLNLGLDTSSGLDIGANATQRFYVGKEYSINPGIALDYNTGRGSLSLGLLGGGSWYFEKNNSLDLLLSLNGYIGNGAGFSAGFYLGMTRYM